MEEVKLSLFEDNRILYVEKFTYFTKNPVRTNKKYSAKYKNNT